MEANSPGDSVGVLRGGGGGGGASGEGSKRVCTPPAECCVTDVILEGGSGTATCGVVWDCNSGIAFENAGETFIIPPLKGLLGVAELGSNMILLVDFPWGVVVAGCEKEPSCVVVTGANLSRSTVGRVYDSYSCPCEDRSELSEICPKEEGVCKAEPSSGNVCEPCTSREGLPRITIGEPNPRAEDESSIDAATPEDTCRLSGDALPLTLTSGLEACSADAGCSGLKECS